VREEDQRQKDSECNRREQHGLNESATVLPIGRKPRRVNQEGPSTIRVP